MMFRSLIFRWIHWRLWQLQRRRSGIDCYLENVGNMSLDDVPIIDIQMDSPEAVATPEEEERDWLLLVMSKHIRMYRVQWALYQQKVREVIEDAKGGVGFEDHRHTFVVEYGQNMELPVFNNE
jgi:hypothetical protein